jgi:UDP-N-acetylglucosamine--N-acetylmuramyl-(pentapeptide) pyrophosphoryl-undecaprenol N-acetylglucosamine transferase
MKRASGKVLFAGGGTGGHVYPALATIEALQKMGEFEILYVGGYAGIENEIVPARGIPYRTLWISGFQRRWTYKNLIFPLKLLVSILQSQRILRQFQPDVVVGTGGYVSGPIVYLAARRGIPTLIQEQDSYPGVTTRLLARHVQAICAPYPEIARHLPEGHGPLHITGNPVRPGLQQMERNQAVRRWNLNPDQPVVFVFGGSQGARALNQAMVKIAPELAERAGVQFLWQTGKKLYQEVADSAAAGHPAIRLLPYVEDMAAAYSAADVIVCRAGAITLAELSVAQKPAILVPYPYAAANHQLHNARAIANKGAAVVVTEGEEFVPQLRQELEKLLGDANLRRNMSQAWKHFYRPEAARQIASMIVEMMNTQPETNGKKG